MFTIKKVFLKNLTFFVWSLIEKTATTVLQVSKVMLSIFQALTLVDCTTKPNFSTKTGYIILTLLPESKKANIGPNAGPIWVKPLWKIIRYWIYIICSRFLVLTNIISLLFSVTDIEIAKIYTRFLAPSYNTC